MKKPMTQLKKIAQEIYDNLSGGGVDDLTLGLLIELLKKIHEEKTR